MSVDNEDSSSIDDVMFPPIVLPGENAPNASFTGDRIKFSIPQHPSGKGWLPKECESEQEMFIGSIAFLKAIADGDWAQVNRCLMQRVDLDFVDSEGRSAIHLAISARHAELLRFLVGQCADVTSVTDDGRTALHYAVAHNDIRAVVLLLHLHKLNGESDKTIHRLVKETGDNALHLAALWGNVRIAKRLIKAGVDFTCKNKAGQTPLMVAETFEHVELANLLRSYIEKEKSDIAAEMQKQRDELVVPSWNRTVADDGAPPSVWRGTAPNYVQLSLDHYGIMSPSNNKRARRVVRFQDSPPPDEWSDGGAEDNEIHCNGFGYFGGSDDDELLRESSNRQRAGQDEFVERERRFWENKKREPVDDDDVIFAPAPDDEEDGPFSGPLFGSGDAEDYYEDNDEWEYVGGDIAWIRKPRGGDNDGFSKEA